jgi:hypothetical protein
MKKILLAVTCLVLRALLVAVVTLGAAAYGDVNDPVAPPPDKLPPSFVPGPMNISASR